VEWMGRRLCLHAASCIVGSWDSSYLNVTLEARHRRRMEADWLGADIIAAITRLA